MQDWFDNLDPIFLPDAVNRQHPLNQGRVAWWMVVPSLDGGRLWYDVLAYYHGTLTSMSNVNNGWSNLTRSGGWGSLLFDGSAGRVVTSTTFNPGAGNFTLSAWVNARNITGAGYTFASSNYSGGVELWCGTYGSGIFQYKAYIGDATVISSSTAIAASTWYYLAASRAGGTYTLWVNGAQAASGTKATAVTLVNLNIGCRQGGTTLWTGYIDDVSIWNRALSAAEVWELYRLSQLGYPGVLNRLAPLPWPVVAGPPPTITAWPAAILGHL